MAWVHARKPTWGTCAGMVLLADRAQGKAAGGQELLGGLDVEVSRNYFGSQQSSFEAPLDVASTFAAVDGAPSAPHQPHRGVFIRAPAVLSIGGSVQPLAWLPTGAKDGTPLIVAVQDGPLIATAFHPELYPADSSWHRYFAALVEARVGHPLGKIVKR